MSFSNSNSQTSIVIGNGNTSIQNADNSTLNINGSDYWPWSVYLSSTPAEYQFNDFGFSLNPSYSSSSTSGDNSDSTYNYSNVDDHSYTPVTNNYYGDYVDGNNIQGDNYGSVINNSGDNNTFGDVFTSVNNGRDRLTGTEGDDVLVSNRGRDVLTGNSGADFFVINEDGRDKVTDFDETEGDKLLITSSTVTAEEDVTYDLIDVSSRKEVRSYQFTDNFVYLQGRGQLYYEGDLLAKLGQNTDLTEVTVVDEAIL